MRKSLVPVTIAIHPIQSTDQMEMNPGRASAYKKISTTEPKKKKNESSAPAPHDARN